MSETTLDEMMFAEQNIWALLNSEDCDSAWPTAMETARKALSEGIDVLWDIIDLAENWAEEPDAEKLPFNQAAEQILQLALATKGTSSPQ